MFKPGYLTAEFINGRRVRYVPPFRLYLIVSFIFFGLVTLNNNSKEEEQQQIAFNFKENGDDLFSYFKNNGSPESLLDSFKIEHSSTNIFLAGQGLKMLRDDGKSFKQKLFENISLMMFILMPFFALTLGLVNIRKKLYFTTHMVFSYHIHSFLFLILSIGIIISKITDHELFYFGLAVWAIFYSVQMFRKIYPGKAFTIFMKLFIISGLHTINLLILFILNMLFTALLL